MKGASLEPGSSYKVIQMILVVLSIYSFLGNSAGKTGYGYSGAIMAVTTQNGYSHVELNPLTSI
jgi:hypothetical protein